MNKVYCPREVFPIASVGVAAVDMAVALPTLAVLFLVFGYAPRATSVWVPLLLVVQVAFTLGVVFVLSAIIVYLRDLRFVLPIVLQLGLFATPVAYPIEQFVPGPLRMVYAAINPLAPVVDGYRRTVLLGLAPDWKLLLVGGATSFIILVVGYVFFKRLETGLADVA
jgi:ABC-2 type transport system permease protein/lipopolysaccharide transport system permease protein